MTGLARILLGITLLMVLPACERSVYPFAPTRQCYNVQHPNQPAVLDSVPFALPPDSLGRAQVMKTLCARMAYDWMEYLTCLSRFARAGVYSDVDTIYLTQRLVDDNCWISYFPEGWDRDAPNPYNPWGL